jgi:hypothetical protein
VFAAELAEQQQRHGGRGPAAPRRYIREEGSRELTTLHGRRAASERPRSARVRGTDAPVRMRARGTTGAYTPAPARSGGVVRARGTTGARGDRAPSARDVARRGGDRDWANEPTPAGRRRLTLPLQAAPAGDRPSTLPLPGVTCEPATAVTTGAVPAPAASLSAVVPPAPCPAAVLARVLANAHPRPAACAGELRRSIVERDEPPAAVARGSGAIADRDVALTNVAAPQPPPASEAAPATASPRADTAAFDAIAPMTEPSSLLPASRARGARRRRGLFIVATLLACISAALVALHSGPVPPPAPARPPAAARAPVRRVMPAAVPRVAADAPGDDAVVTPAGRGADAGP